MIPNIKTSDGFQVVINGEMFLVSRSHDEYDALWEAVKDGDEETFVETYSAASSVEKHFEGTDIVVDEGIVYYNDIQIDNSLSERIVQYVEDDEDPTYLVRFLDNLMDNPSSRAVNELYSFLEHRGIPITEDGHFLAYKAVTSNYKDKFSKTFDNSVGAINEMPRNQVDDNYSKHCSYGFHVGAYEYAGPDGWFTRSNDKVMLVKVNPRDAVSVPNDHGLTKLRVCRYEVVDELECVNTAPLNESVNKDYGDRDTYSDRNTAFSSLLFDRKDMTDVDSSVIQAYRVDAGDLYVLFNNGFLYVYRDLAHKDIKSFVESDSKGRFFNEHIKGSAAWEKWEKLGYYSQ